MSNAKCSHVAVFMAVVIALFISVPCSFAFGESEQSGTSQSETVDTTKDVSYGTENSGNSGGGVTEVTVIRPKTVDAPDKDNIKLSSNVLGSTVHGGGGLGGSGGSTGHSALAKTGDILLSPIGWVVSAVLMLGIAVMLRLRNIKCNKL